MDIEKKISELRRDCLVHRFRYYVLCDPLISDIEYDHLEKELTALVEANPEAAQGAEYSAYCPSCTAGSELESSYPDEIVRLAESA